MIMCSSNCLGILTSESPFLYLMDIPFAAAGVWCGVVCVCVCVCVCVHALDGWVYMCVVCVFSMHSECSVCCECCAL